MFHTYKFLPLNSPSNNLKNQFFYNNSHIHPAFEYANSVFYMHVPLYHYRKSINSGLYRYNPNISEGTPASIILALSLPTLGHKTCIKNLCLLESVRLNSFSSKKCRDVKLEIFIIDDGSEEECARLCDSFKDKDCRIQVHCQHIALKPPLLYCKQV